MATTTKEKSKGGGFINGEVSVFSELATIIDALANPPPSVGDIYLVQKPTGTWVLGTKKKAGMYRKGSSSWEYMGSEVPQVSDTEIMESSTDKHKEIRRFAPINIAQISYQNILLVTRGEVITNEDGNHNAPISSVAAVAYVDSQKDPAVTPAEVSNAKTVKSHKRFTPYDVDLISSYSVFANTKGTFNTNVSNPINATSVKSHTDSLKIGDLNNVSAIVNTLNDTSQLGYNLTWGGSTFGWLATQPPVIPTDLNGLSDVDMVTYPPKIGDVLQYYNDGAGARIIPLGMPIGGLSNVSPHANIASEGQVLTFVAGQWVSRTPIAVDGAQVTANTSNITTNRNDINSHTSQIQVNKNNIESNNSLSLKLYSKFLLQYFRADTSPVQYLGATMTCSYDSAGRVIVKNNLGDNFPDNYIVNVQVYTNDRSGDMVRRNLIVTDTYLHQFTVSSYDIPTESLLDSDARVMISIYYAEPE